MGEARIQYRGRYLYADAASVERALISARAELDDDVLAAAGVRLRFVVVGELGLEVEVSVTPGRDHRFLAPNLFLVLAYRALDGTVEIVTDEPPLARSAWTKLRAWRNGSYCSS